MRIFNFREVVPQIPNLLFRRRLQFIFEHLPFEASKLSWKKRLNFFVAGLNQFILPDRPMGYPVIAQVEPINICNLKCSLCLTASQNNSRPPARLTLEVFKRFIDEIGDYLLLIVLWNWGEPFLNPDIYDMIAYATSRGILVHSSTNGNVRFDAQTAERIVSSGLTSLIFAVDGATQETYSSYRRGGDLERVQNNIRVLVDAKKRLMSAYPKITVRFVAMRQNEPELPLVEKMARELGADFFSVKTVDMPVPLGSRLDHTYRPDQTEYRRYEYLPGTYIRQQRPFQCMRPWKRVTLDALGEVISCEYDYKDQYSFGSIMGESSVVSIWKSMTSRVFRHNFSQGHNKYYHCKDCTYKNMLGEDCIVYAQPLASSFFQNTAK